MKFLVVIVGFVALFMLATFGLALIISGVPE